MPASRRLVLFDLDHTLVDADSNEQWMHFLIDAGQLDRDRWAPATEQALARYRTGNVSSAEYQAFFVGTLRDLLPEALARLNARYVRDRMVPAIVPAAASLLARHRAAGDLLVLTSATNRFLVSGVSRALGFDNLLATECEMLAGRYTGRVAGEPNMREGKVTRLEQWLAARGERLADYAESWFYSDSINDRALLEAVTRPIATDPDPALARLAGERGWPVVSLRSLPAPGLDLLPITDEKTA